MSIGEVLNARPSRMSIEEVLNAIETCVSLCSKSAMTTQAVSHSTILPGSPSMLYRAAMPQPESYASADSGLYRPELAASIIDFHPHLAKLEPPLASNTKGEPFLSF